MPSFNIVKESKSSNSFRSNSLRNTFDIHNNQIKEHFKADLPIEDVNWNVGIIYGRSGTGKSTIANHLFPKELDQGKNIKWESESMIDDFKKTLSVKEISSILTSVGLSTVPSWLKPYSVLSEGEKMRANLARSIIEQDFIVFDEYTSVVDREVAKIASYVTSKNIRKFNKKFIAVSCHSDIIDWLEPDWIFCTDNMKFEIVKKKDQKLKLKSTNKKDTGIFLKSITI